MTRLHQKQLLLRTLRYSRTIRKQESTKHYLRCF